MTTASDAARLANRTRQERAAIDTLRDGHFVRAEKNDVRDQVLDFLGDYMEPGDAMGDLLGPGWSAMAATERGMKVLAVDNLRYPTRVLGDRDLAERALRRMGDEGGFPVAIGSFRSIVHEVATAFYDPCGPPSEKWSADIRAMAEAGLKAFAATALLSRVDGARGLGEDAYVRLARMTIEDAAPAYRIERTIRYRGEYNLPMAVLLVVRGGVYPKEWTTESETVECDNCGEDILRRERVRGGRGFVEWVHLPEHKGWTGLKGCRAYANAIGKESSHLKNYLQARNHRLANRLAIEHIRATVPRYRLSA